MKTFRISYTTICPTCSHAERYNWRGLGESHAERIQEQAKEGLKRNHLCAGCRKIVDAQLISVEVAQEGVKR